MSPEDLLRLVANGENEKLELKASVPTPEEIARHIATFANTDGGLLVLGIKEPAQVVGVNDHRARAMIIAAQRQLSPAVSINVESLALGGHPVVVAHVEASSELISASGGYYVRSGERIRPMSAEEIRAHASAKKNETTAIAELSTAIATQTANIDKLRSDFDRVNSPSRKIFIGLIGAAAGTVVRFLIDQFLN